MSDWLTPAVMIGVAALGAITVIGAYSMLRLRPSINALRHVIMETRARLEAELEDTKGWRNDERRLSRLLEAQQSAHRLLARQVAQLDKASSANLAALKTAEGLTREAQLSAEKLAQSHAAMSEEIKAIAASMALLPSANSTRATQHNRLLTAQAARDLTKSIAPKFGLSVSERQLYHLAHRCCMLEERLHGRLATSIDAMMTRLMGALFLANDRPDVFRLLEIGTLYGQSAIVLHDAVRFRVNEARLVLLDPLDGYYKSGDADFISMKPVSRQVLEENLRLAEVPAADVEIIQVKSESDDALSALHDSEFDMLVIDGDHSFDGVKRDFENYFPKVRLGGLIVVDDYDVAEWPAIKRYADEHLVGRANLQLIFSGYRTLLLRKI